MHGRVKRAAWGGVFHEGYLPSCSVASEVSERAREPAVDFIKC